MKIVINTDGGARGNPGPAASAFVAKDEAGNVLEKSGKYLGETTNNVAEYQAVVMALVWLKGEQVGEVLFLLDSNLVVQQLMGNFKVKDPGLKQLFEKIKALEKEIGIPIVYSFVPREKNFEADKLVNETLDQNLLSQG